MVPLTAPPPRSSPLLWHLLFASTIMDDYGVALEPLQQLIKELTPDGAWLFGPEGKALAKLPSLGFAWQEGAPVAIGTRA
jgi:hypothetical protein